MIRTEHREEKWVFAFIEYSPEKNSDNKLLIMRNYLIGYCLKTDSSS